MNKSVLIDCVKETTCLWDPKDTEYCNKEMKTEIWSRIGRELQVTGDEAKNTWMCLRDSFRRLLIKQQNKDNLLEGVRWSYFKKMLFLKDVIRSHHYLSNVDISSTMDSMPDGSRSIDNLQDDSADMSIPAENTAIVKMEAFCDDTNQDDNESMNYIDNMPNDCSTLDPIEISLVSGVGKVEPTDQPSKRNPVRRYKKKGRPSKLELNSIVGKKEPDDDDEVEDSDYHFVMSLLPSLRRVPEHRKNVLRVRMMKMIMRESERAKQNGGF